MSIGTNAFRYCNSLNDIAIPDGVTNIADWAFYGCENMMRVTIPDSVISIGSQALAECSSLKIIEFGGTKAQWNAITKGEKWDAYTDNYTVHCTDGDIT